MCTEKKLQIHTNLNLGFETVDRLSKNREEEEEEEEENEQH